MERSPFDALYPPDEKIPVLVAPDFPSLGQLTALRFLEWVAENPEGRISLPTGKTPEFFIKWIRHLLGTWETPSTRALLQANGLDSPTAPDLSGLHFIQIDEFYPLPPSQRNSFCGYVRSYYVDAFGLDPDKALLIDSSRIALDPGETIASVWPGGMLDLTASSTPTEASGLNRRQRRILRDIGLWCEEYEERIRSLGGIEFFLGGIGPDGHIAFNVRGSPLDSRTRLTMTNYETQAAAASDLGGIAYARRLPVITIGLGTITANPACTAIVMAAGVVKAPMVADAVQQHPDPRYPATALHGLPHARFYVTPGAAGALDARRRAAVATAETVDDETSARIVIDLARRSGKCLRQLNAEALRADNVGCALERRADVNPDNVCRNARTRVAKAVARGNTIFTGRVVLHTEPHHDDIMLGYLPAILRNPDNTHHVATLTSGFTAVTNEFLMAELQNLLRYLADSCFERCAIEHARTGPTPGVRRQQIANWRAGLAADDIDRMAHARASRRVLDACQVFWPASPDALRSHVQKTMAYLETSYPGSKDPPPVQTLKGACREWESECLWAECDLDLSNIHHLRLGFYTGDLFTPQPTERRDVPPILRLLDEVEPDILTVALDPEASGPDTHYKCLQATRAALETYLQRHPKRDVRVWGYRNVWTRFHLSETTHVVPVSEEHMERMNTLFVNCFATQRDAPFPSYELDGPFCQLAQAIQQEQRDVVLGCLDCAEAVEPEADAVRAARGAVYIREMTSADFLRYGRSLEQAIEGQP